MGIDTGESAYNFILQAADAGFGPQDVPMQCHLVSLERGAYSSNVPDANYCFVNMKRMHQDLNTYNDFLCFFKHQPVVGS